MTFRGNQRLFEQPHGNLMKCWPSHFFPNKRPIMSQSCFICLWMFNFSTGVCHCWFMLSGFVTQILVFHHQIKVIPLIPLSISKACKTFLSSTQINFEREMYPSTLCGCCVFQWADMLTNACHMASIIYHLLHQECSAEKCDKTFQHWSAMSFIRLYSYWQ